MVQALIKRLLAGGGHEGPLPPALERHMGLRKRTALSTPLSEVEFAVFDTELTGLDMKSDAIVSIGAVRMKGAAIYPGRQFYSLVRPECGLRHETVVIHEITHDDIASCAREAEGVLLEFLDFIGDAVLAGHFVQIDVGFVNKAMRQLFGAKLQSHAVDTLALHQRLVDQGTEFSRHFHGTTRKVDLFSMAKAYGLSTVKTHNALYDAMLAAELLQRFLHFLPGAGVRTLGDLVAAGRS